MARTITIIRYQGRAYWRRLSRGGRATAGNQGILLIIFGLGFIRYLMFLRVAAISLPQGKTALLEKLLLAIFVVWLFPLVGGGQTSLATRRWLHLPLSLKELFRLRVVSLLLPPSSWIVIAASLLICYPLAHGPRPFAGIAAALLFILSAGFVGLTLSHLIGIVFWRRVFLTVAVVLSGAVAVAGGNDPKNLLLLAKLSPSILVAHAALGERAGLAIVIIAAFCAVTFGTALWSLRLSLENTASRNPGRSRTLGQFNFPGRLGGLVAKDFRYFRRLLDVYLGLPAVAAACVYLATAEAPTRSIFLSFICIVFLFGAAVAFNSFGLDARAGLARYSLLPLNGPAILLSKNLAYLIIMSIQLLPLVLLASWRMGIVTGALGLLVATATACAYLTCGNWMSINHPLKMQFYSFASSGAALADALAGIVFGSVPGILIIYLLQTPSTRAGALVAVVVLFFAALYCASVVRFGRRFDRKRENISYALS